MRWDLKTNPRPAICRGLFITGTDTGVGKTAVASAIVRLLSGTGTRVGAYKPVVSGADPGPDGPVWNDVEVLHAALGGRYSTSQICPQRFLAPLAPPVAAAIEGRTVDRRLLRSGAEPWRKQVDLLVVEGAGGLLSPVSEVDSVADLAGDLGYPLLIVARLGLGTINHTLLTVEAAAARGLAIAGIILNQSDRSDPSNSTNPGEIARRCSTPVLAVIGYTSAGDLLAAGELQRIDWSSLARSSRAQPASE